MSSRSGTSPPGPRRNGSPEPRTAVELHVPLATIVKVLVVALLIWAALKLTLALLFFLVAVLFAVALSSPMLWLEERGVSHALAASMMAVAVLAGIGLFLAFVMPPLLDQVMVLVRNFPEYRARVEENISSDHPVLKGLVSQILKLPDSPQVAASLKEPLAWGRVAITGAIVAILLLVLTVYLLLDGKRLYAWLLAYVPRGHRHKAAQTVPEVFEVVIAYVRGQAFTSLLCGLFSLAVLSIFRVPAAIPLALLAAVADVLPILGIVISTVPAVLLAATVSPVAGGAVLLLYSLYHLAENYVIIPRVYGRRLRLSGLAVLIALVIGGTLHGVLGAILVLPLVAAYPIIERIWLHEYLSTDVITEHTALERAAEEGTDEAVDRVLEGEKEEKPKETKPKGSKPKGSGLES